MKTKQSIHRLNSEKGQSIIILVFSFVGLIALLGLGIDSGMVYIEKTQLGRAIDAATLSGVTELSNEEQAITRAIDYLGLNTYDLNDSNIYVRGCISDRGDWYGPPSVFRNCEGCGDGDTNQLVNPPYGASSDFWYPYLISDADDNNVTNVFYIDTYSYQTNHQQACSQAILGEANKISITGTVKVKMNFFQLLGRPFVPVTYNAVAQNIDSIDAVVVLDRSGSMQFDPVCYNCWEKTATPDAAESPPYVSYYTYPTNGVIYPLGLSDGFANVNRIKACTTDSYRAALDLQPPDNNGYQFDPDDTVYISNGFHYTVIEAELYSLNPNPADDKLRASGKGYWAMQRGEPNYNYSNNNLPYYNSSGTSIDTRPAHMSYHPTILSSGDAVFGKHYTLEDTQAGNNPAWLEYDFHLYEDAGWIDGSYGYIWVRAHVGRGVDRDSSGCDTTYPWADCDRDKAYWALTEYQGDVFQPLTPPTGTDVHEIRDSSGHLLRNSSDFIWIRFAQFRIHTDHNYRLYIFAGSPGYSIDRIVITDNSDTTGDNTTTQPGRALSWQARNSLPTAASAYRAACDRCNVVYGENITDPDNQCTFFNRSPNRLRLFNVPTNNAIAPQFDEWEQPLRKAKEAIKFFITRLDPERDQVGFVYYSSHGAEKTELECKRSEGANCATGSHPISFTTVLKNVEDTWASGGTPTFNGMKMGMEVLGTQLVPGEPSNFDTLCDGSPNSSCSRAGKAQRVLILLTDGNPNSTRFADGTGNHDPYAVNAPACYDSTAPQWPRNNTPNYRCPLQYAQMAAESGITVYTIGLGYGVDRDWLKEVARLGNGQAYFSISGGDLTIIFNQILSNIYVRLIQ